MYKFTNLTAFSLLTISISIISMEPDKNQNATGSLINAAWHNQKNRVQDALDQGANVNGRGVYDRSALDWAVRNRNADMVSELLHNGADIQSKSKSLSEN